MAIMARLAANMAGMIGLNLELDGSAASQGLSRQGLRGGRLIEAEATIVRPFRVIRARWGLNGYPHDVTFREYLLTGDDGGRTISRQA